MEPTQPQSDDANHEATENISVVDSRSTTEVIEPAAHAAAVPVDVASVQRPKRTKIKLLIILAIALVVLAAGGAAAYWFGFRDEPVQTAEQNTAVTATPTEVVVEAQPTEKPEAQVVDGIAFLAEPQLQTTGLFVNPDFMNQGCDGAVNCETQMSEVRHYKVATLTDGAGLFVVELPPQLMSGVMNLWYSEKNGQYTVYLRGVFGDAFTADDFNVMYGVSVQKSLNIDSTTLFKPLLFPKTSQVGNQNVKLTYESNLYAGFFPKGLSDKGVGLTKVGTKDDVTFYTVTNQSVPEEGYEVKTYYGLRYGYFGSIYESDGEVAKSNITPIKITWTSGAKPAEANYGRASQGCGATSSFMVATGISKPELLSVGKTPGNQTVYALPESSPLFKSIYSKDYKPNSQYLQDETLKGLSEADFQAQHGIIVVENANNELVVFLRGGMFVGGGCAKPVVYLYPERATMVDVAVGADVVISDPIYPADGWQNVLAQPDGSLLYNGRTYGSLFWEGYGSGRYPDLAERGVVVPTSAAANTIRQHLIAQGLLVKEIEDFMAFWEPRLPHQPYTRLTWLTGAELHALAPLTVSPQPQTVIRVFLDFEGLDAYRALTPQSFRAPVRAGFTVVEWGGLARHGLAAL